MLRWMTDKFMTDVIFDSLTADFNLLLVQLQVSGYRYKSNFFNFMGTWTVPVPVPVRRLQEEN